MFDLLAAVSAKHGAYVAPAVSRLRAARRVRLPQTRTRRRSYGVGYLRRRKSEPPQQAS